MSKDIKCLKCNAKPDDSSDKQVKLELFDEDMCSSAFEFWVPWKCLGEFDDQQEDLRSELLDSLHIAGRVCVVIIQQWWLEKQDWFDDYSEYFS